MKNFKTIIKTLLISTSFISTIHTANHVDWKSEIHWDWSTIPYQNVFTFPDTFLWGGADSGMQTEGTLKCDGTDSKNSWTEFEKVTCVPLGQRAHHAFERKKRYKEDAELLEKLGFKIHRFSILWDKVEPELGIFDHTELDWYVAFCNELCARGIRPMICFMHHEWPIWFDKLDAFENVENIKHYVNYVTYTYEYLFTHVNHPEMLDYVLTFNEPAGYVMEAYFRGAYPPGKKAEKFNHPGQLALCGRVLKNMLDAHIIAYDHLKRINPNVQISMAIMFTLLDTYHQTGWHPLSKFAASFGNYILLDSTLNYFKTGHYSFATRGLITEFNAEAIGKLDFIGLNYYSHTLIDGIKHISGRPGDTFSHRNSHSIYPEGLYRAIVRSSELKKPIIITENGISTLDNALKNEYLQKHLYVVHKALLDGYDIRGYMWWAPIDCWGWKGKYDSYYGFYGVDRNTKERYFRPGTTNHLEKTIKLSRKYTDPSLLN